MSSLARRTLATTATVAGVAALGAAFAGQAFAADLPSLPAAPELPTEAPAAPAEAPALEAPAAPAAPELPTDFESFSVPGVANLETPNVSFESAGNSSTADIPAASHEAAHEAPALPALPDAVASHLPTTGGELATPQATLPLAGPELPAAPELPALPSTADQDLDTQDVALPTSDLAAPNVAQQIASLAG